VNREQLMHWARAGLSQGLGAPILLLLMLAMMVVPLPPFALDVLFTFNIALSLLIILGVIYVARPLDFGVFPTVLLGATMLRLALNVAAARVVLLHGHEGPYAAGHVIHAFGEFVIGGNYAVGLVVFSILIIINFIVVTKGATRVSEVSARFTLDSMPGKQMAIDADLNAGLLTAEEARSRREEVREEADFYGSMDGASKFVRGDAIAAILILFVNIVGGLTVGVLQHDLSFSDALHTYTLLTIGDGLVAQIPMLMLSTSVAIIVTRMSGRQNMGAQVAAQVFSQPRALAVTAGVLGLLGLVPGMPNGVFLVLAIICGGIAYALHRRGRRDELVPEQAPAPAPENRELSWEDVAPVDVIGLEVGYRLIPLVDKDQGGELMGRIKGVRKKLSQELGFLIPPVHIRDNLELKPNAYRISLMGVPVGEAEVHADRILAINPGKVYGELAGIPTRDPAFDMDAVWIEPSARDHAQTIGYTTVDVSTVVATHLSHLLQSHAHELLGHEEVQHLLDRLAKTAPKLVEDLVPKRLSLGVLVKVLQGLLAERIPIRNMRTIAESLAENAVQTQDPAILLAAVRVALGRQIIQGINGMDSELPVITLDPELEQLLQQSVQQSGPAGPGIEPGLAERMQRSIAESAMRQQASGQSPVLLVAPTLRAWLSRFMHQVAPNLHVLAYNEVPDNKSVRLIGAVGQ
jgi:flagellar biosynthesis protein FlhA